MAEKMVLFSFLESTGLPDWMLFLVVFALALVLGKLASFLIETKLKALAKKTKSEFDDVLLDAISGPLMVLFVLGGLYAGFPYLSEFFDASSIGFVQHVLQIALILDLAWFLVKIFDGIVQHFLRPLSAKAPSKFDDHLVGIVSKIGKFLIIAIALLVVLSEFGFDVTAIIAGLGIGGIAIAFAAQSTIADVFGGFSIYTSKPFKIGDVVAFGTLKGTVKEIGLRYSRIIDFDNRLITVPNSTIAKENVMNWSSEPSRRVVTSLSLVYETSPEKIEQAIEIVKSVIAGNPNCQKDGLASFEEFKDYYLSLRVIYYITPSDNFREYTEHSLAAKNAVNLEIKKRFKKAGIEFAYPTQSVYLYK